jgi:translation initiation factor 2 subunit 1
MFYFKSGFPEENEVVVCTVTSVQYNSVFCTLDEYDKSGMIHISEISAGRIRNIRDFVVEGKKVVCKVLRTSEERGHIDLSLRRVNENQRREKNMLIKQEQKAEKIIENLAAELKQEPKTVYDAIATPILTSYEYLHMALQEYVDGEADLATLGIPQEYLATLLSRVKEKIKAKSVTITGTLSLSTYAEDGVELVRQALIAAKATSPHLSLSYLGSGNYQVQVEAEEYKEAEAILDKAIAAATALVRKTEGAVVEFVRA